MLPRVATLPPSAPAAARVTGFPPSLLAPLPTEERESVLSWVGLGGEGEGGEESEGGEREGFFFFLSGATFVRKRILLLVVLLELLLLGFVDLETF